MGDGCLGEDALKASWYFQQDLVYANPPWNLAERVIAKLQRDKVHRCILVLPFRNSTLDRISVAKPIRLRHTDSLFLPPSKGSHRSWITPLEGYLGFSSLR